MKRRHPDQLSLFDVHLPASVDAEPVTRTPLEDIDPLLEKLFSLLHKDVVPERTPFSDSEIRHRAKHFVKELSRIGGHERDLRDTFMDFLELSYCAFAKLTAHPDRRDDYEDRYMKVVGRYKDKDSIRAMKPLMHMAWETVEAGGCDFLGVVAAEQGMLNAGAGQFFTPFEVARMMAAINVTDPDPVIAQRGYITVSEPASGAGGLLLAFADELEAKGYLPYHRMFASAVDVSALAFRMTFLQLTWRGIPAEVIWGNSLSMEITEVAWTPAIYCFIQKHGELPWLVDKTGKGRTVLERALLENAAARSAAS